MLRDSLVGILIRTCGTEVIFYSKMANFPVCGHEILFYSTITNFPFKSFSMTSFRVFQLDFYYFVGVNFVRVN